MEFCSTCAMEWAGALVAIIVGIYLYGTWHYGEFKKRNLPFLRPTFFLGNMGPFTLGRLSYTDQSVALYKRFKGHRAVGIFNFRKPKVYVRDPDIVKLVTMKDFEYFTDHQQFNFDEKDDLLFGKFLFGMKGRPWRMMRHLVTPAFTSIKMKAMFELVAACGDQLAEFLDHKIRDAKDGVQKVELRDLFSRFANDVIATSAYGIHCDSLRQPHNEFFELGTEIIDLGGLRGIKFLLYNSIPTLMRLLRIELTPPRLTNFFVSIVRDTMRARERENIVRPDIIQLLMEARKGKLTEGDAEDVQLLEARKSTPTADDEVDMKNEDKAKRLAFTAALTDEDIAAQAFIFFVAGFDTASTVLSFLCYELALHPDIQDRVRREIDVILREHEGRLTYEGVLKMKYLDTVVSEILRLWPPVPDIDRACVQDYTVPATPSQPAVVFKKGDGVTIPAHGIQRDPEYFPDPERFDPDRFSEENKHKIKPGTYLPFGLGPRNCIGIRFANMETKIAIASVLSRFELEVCADTPIPLRLAKNTFNTKTEQGMWVAVRARSQTAQ